MRMAKQNRQRTTHFLVLACVVVWGVAIGARAREQAVPPQLGDFDAWMEKVLKDWNAPGVAVGVVAKDKLVFAKGYG